MSAQLHETLKKAFEFLAKNELEYALDLLQGGIKKAIKEKNQSYTVHFARNAGLLCDRMGKQASAARYYKLALRYGRNDATNYYSLGEFYERIGKVALSRRYFRACRKIAIERADESFIEILDKRKI